MPTIEMMEMYKETLTPEEFIHVYETERNDIRSARVVPAQLGDGNFGSIVIERKTPTYIRQTLRANKNPNE